MSTGNADDATPADDVRAGALPVGHSKCERVTVRVREPTLSALEELVEADHFASVSSALRAGAYDVVEAHSDDQEGRR